MGKMIYSPMSKTELFYSISKWIKNWFYKNAPGHKAVIGISGGKDSTICAYLMTKVLGQNNVIGVAMPDEGQSVNDADKICEKLGIQYMYCPIGEITKIYKNSVDGLSEQSIQNLAPRVRMAMLYMIAQSNSGIVINTCNLSEDYIGYSTLYGDLAGSMSPFGKLTVKEIKDLGYYMGVPEEWIERKPDDGLQFSKPDEEKFGFTYAELDLHIRYGYKLENPEAMDKIILMHTKNKFKREILNIPTFDPGYPVYEP